MNPQASYTTHLRRDGTISVPYQLFKKGGLLHKVRHLAWEVVGDGAVLEPVQVLWLKAPKKPTRVVVHRKKDGTGLWAEAPAFPDLRVEGSSLQEIKRLMGCALLTISKEGAAHGS